MTTNLIDLRQSQKASADDLHTLQAYLTQLVGEPFRFARVSYGDELTLHFGDLRPGRSPKRNKEMYGAFILGMRASPWILKSGAEPLVLTAGVLSPPLPPEVARSLSNEELESTSFIQPESRVLAAIAFVVKPANMLGLQLQLSDGSTFLVLPTVWESDDSEGETLPELADWELLSPGGLLSAGPGLNWAFEATAT